MTVLATVSSLLRSGDTHVTDPVTCTKGAEGTQPGLSEEVSCMLVSVAQPAPDSLRQFQTQNIITA